MNNKNIRYGLIGAGAIAQTWAQALDLSRTSRLVAVADMQKSKAQSLGKKFGCQSFGAYETMLASCYVDAVIVGTPPATHPSIAMYCLRKNIHVLCEKPFSIDSWSAQEMFQEAQTRNTLITMASKFRYVDDLIRAKRIVRSGILGDIVSFKNSFISHVDMSQRWNSDPQISGGGVLIDNGTHSVDIIRYFLGPIREIYVSEGRRSQNLRVEESVHIQARTESGCEAKIDLFWNGKKDPKSYIQIQGTKGMTSIGWKESKYRQSSSSEWAVFGSGYDKLDAFIQQLDNFSNSILGNELLIITHEDALASVKVIEAGYRSLGEGGWISIAQQDRYTEHLEPFYERVEGQRT
jgi:predicted dehydrogenase